jgi:hypothetical protein
VFGAFTTAGGLATGGAARYRAGSWSAAGSGFSPPGRAATGFNDGTGAALYATITGGGSGTVLRWNGTSWDPLAGLGAWPFSGNWGTVDTLATANLGLGLGPALYAAGGFSRIGNVAAPGIAAFAQGSWHAISTTSVPATALAAFDDGSGTTLHAGGTGGVLSRLDGTSWTTLPGVAGANGPFPAPFTTIRALTVFDDGAGARLVAGGRFTSAGGVAAAGMASWNGSAWSSMSFPPGYDVKALLVGDVGAGSQLFAIGQDIAGGFPGIVARRSGAGWQTLAVTSGQGGPAALAVFDDGTGPALYVGGLLWLIDGVAVSGVGRWNGATWSAVQLPSFSNVNGLAVYDDGTGPALFGCGTPFFQAYPIGSQPEVSVARMIAPGNWVPVGGDLQGVAAPYPFQRPIPRALAVYDDGSSPALFVGGTLQGAGGAPSAGIARWGPNRPSLQLIQPAPGAPVTVRNSGLRKGHEYYDIFSDSLCPSGVGTGPYLGICAPDTALVLLEFSFPVGWLPFHWIAPVNTFDVGSYQVPPGLWLDAICFDFTSGVIGCYSPVVRIGVQ